MTVAITDTTQTPRPLLLTKSSQRIIELLYRHRYLTRSQLQSFLGHASHSRVSSHVRSLRSLGLIDAIKLPVGHLPHNPPVYFLTAQSLKFVRLGPYATPVSIKKIYSLPWATPEFVEKSIFLANLCLQLTSTEPGRYSYATAMDPAYTSQLLSPTPDLSIMDAESDNRFVLIMPAVTMPPYQLSKNVTSYFDDLPPESTLLVISQTVTHKLSLRTAVRKYRARYPEPTPTVKTISRDTLTSLGLFNTLWHVV